MLKQEWSSQLWENYAFEARVKILQLSTVEYGTFDMLFRTQRSDCYKQECPCYKWNVNTEYLVFVREPGWIRSDDQIQSPSEYLVYAAESRCLAIKCVDM